MTIVNFVFPGMKKIVVIMLCALSALCVKAVDFSFRDAEGNNLVASGYATDYRLVFVYNSGCDLCSKAAQQIEESSTVSFLIENNRLTVISIALFEVDDAWMRKAATFPQSWVNGVDAFDEIIEGEVFDFETVPAYYLLDRNGDVIFQNVSFTAMDDFLGQRR